MQEQSTFLDLSGGVITGELELQKLRNVSSNVKKIDISFNPKLCDVRSSFWQPLDHLLDPSRTWEPYCLGRVHLLRFRDHDVALTF
jgi:hypothetical protein